MLFWPPVISPAQSYVSVGKSFLYRWFGVGRMPPQVLSQVQSEGLLVFDEGVKASVIYKDFRAPGRRDSWRRQWFPASIALTKTRLLALWYSNPVINVPLSDERIRAMQFSLEKDGLCVTFDAALFHPDWSGTIEYRFRTPQAQHLLEKIGKGAVI
jgi:hypothetical protein